MDRQLTLIQSDSGIDWYTIEWAQHEHKHWAEPLSNNAFALCWSGRPSDADIEGTAAEMAAIADALRDKRSVGFYRCAATHLVGGRFALFSPRNSKKEAIISAEQAEHLAAEIRRVLKNANTGSV